MRASGEERLFLSDRLYKSPYRVIIAIITIWAFLFNLLGMDLAWAANSYGTVLPRSGTAAVGSPGHFLSEFTLPTTLGEVRETHQGLGSKTVIHIQDAHCNYSAQKNIKEIIA